LNTFFSLVNYRDVNTYINRYFSQFHKRSWLKMDQGS